MCILNKFYEHCLHPQTFLTTQLSYMDREHGIKPHVLGSHKEKIHKEALHFLGRIAKGLVEDSTGDQDREPWEGERSS